VTEKPKRWGKGRIVFIADLPAIRAEIARAVPLTEVFASRSARLGIGYSAFCKLVARYAQDAKIQPSAGRTASPAPPLSDGTTHAASPSRKTFAGHKGDADADRIRKLTRG
jgi:hypothetical protein